MANITLKIQFRDGNTAWHYYSNQPSDKPIFVSKAFVDVAQDKFQLHYLAGATGEEILWSDVTVQVGASGSIETFADKFELITRLKELFYEPILNEVPNNVTTVVLRVGDGIWLDCDQQYINDNFDAGTGIGIGERIGWKIHQDSKGCVLVNQGTAPFDVIGDLIGHVNTVLIAHEADSAVLSDGKKGVNTLGTGASENGYVLTEAAANQNIVKTSKVGQDEDGNPSTTEDGVNKNIQPSYVSLYIVRTTDLVVYGNGAVGGNQNLTQVLTQSDISPYTVPIPNNTFVAFDLGRELTENYFTTDDVGTGGVFLDKDVVFPDNSTIRFQAGYVEDNVTPTNVTLLPYRFTTDAYVFYQGAIVTDITLQPEDVCTLKWGGNNSTDSVQIWFLTVVSKSSGGSVDPADLISTDADNALVLGTDSKLFVPEGTTLIDASGGGTTIADGVIEHADGRIKFGSNLVDTEAGLYDVSADRQIATYSETDDFYYYANGNILYNVGTGELIITGGAVRNQDFNDARYIQKETWVDYSATSTVVGWSSFTTKKISYKIIDDVMIVDFNIEGTSNATTISFTIPSNASSATFILSAYIINNGSASSNAGRINSASGSNVITVQRDGQNTAFTASGTKRCSGQITIQL